MNDEITYTETIATLIERDMGNQQTMNTLERIKAKCRMIESSDYRPDTSLPPIPSVTVALARSTIAAIDTHDQMDGGADKHFLAQDIIAAWEGLV